MKYRTVARKKTKKLSNSFTEIPETSLSPQNPCKITDTVEYFDPKNIETKIAGAKNLNDTHVDVTAFIYPENVYKKEKIANSDIKWYGINGAQNIEECELITKQVYNICTNKDISFAYKNNYEAYNGEFLDMKNFELDYSNIRHSVEDPNIQNNTMSKTEMMIDDPPKIIKGLSNAGEVLMYPAVEHINALKQAWVKDKKKLKKRHLTLFQESKSLYYTIEVRNKKSDKAVIRYINLENCYRIKHSELNGKDIIELHVNELIFCFLPADKCTILTWLDKLCSSTGLDLDIQNNFVSNVSKYVRKTFEDSTVWKTSDLPELENYSLMKDRTALKEINSERYDLFNVYPDMLKNYMASFANQQFSETNKHYVKLHLKPLLFALSMNTGSEIFAVEPYVIRCYLYDATLNIKVSEDVYLNTNEDSLLNFGAMFEQTSVSDVMKTSKSNVSVNKIKNVIFEVFKTEHKLYLVMCVMKLFDGKHSHDMYSKPDPKNAQKQHLNVSILSKSNVTYMTNFAYTFMTLNYYEKVTEELELNIYKWDQKISDINKHIMESVIENKKLHTPIPGGRLIGTISVIENIKNEEQLLTSSFEPFNTYKDEITYEILNNDDAVDPITLVTNFQNFVTSVHVYTPRFNGNIYLHPSYINLSNCKFSSNLKFVTIEFTIKEDYNQEPLTVFYSRIGCTSLTALESCTIDSRGDTIVFHDEIKIALPYKLKKNTHLLMTLFNVNIKYVFVENKKKKSSKTALGYSWLSLCSKENILMYQQSFHLPFVAVLPDNYLDYNLSQIENKHPELKFIDGQGKPIFDLKIFSTTNIHSFDKSFDELMNLFENEGVTAANSENMTNLIKVCHCMDFIVLRNYFDVVLQNLFNILVSLNSAKLQPEIISNIGKTITSLLVTLINSLVKKSYTASVKRFIDEKAVVSKSDQYVHVFLLNGLNDIVTTDPKSLTTTFENVWFFFAVILKSFKTAAQNKVSLKMQSSSSKTLLKNVDWLSKNVILYIISKANNDASKLKPVVDSFARYLGTLMNLIDKNLVVKMISHSYELFKFHDKKIKSLYILRFELLQKLLKHEFFMNINLPTSIPLKLSQFGNVSQMYLSSRYYEDHYLIAIVFEELQKSFYESPHTFSMSVNLIRSLLFKIHFDERYKKTNVMAHLICMFVPFLTVLVENAQILNDMITNESTDTSCNTVRRSSIKKTNSSLMTLTPSMETIKKKPKPTIFAADESTEMDLTKKQIRELFICFLYVIQKINPTYLQAWWNNLSQMNLKTPVSVQNNFKNIYGNNCTIKQSYLVNFLLLLKLSITAFKFENKTKTKNEIILESLSSGLAGTKAALHMKNLRQAAPNKTYEDLVNVELVLSEEIIILVLNTLDAFNESQKLSIKSNSGNNAITNAIFDIYIYVLGLNKTKLIDKIFMNYFRIYFQMNFYVMFRGPNDFLEKIYILLFTKLSEVESSIRDEICHFIYLVMKSSFFFTGMPFQRSYIKLIVASTHIMDKVLSTKYMIKSLNTWLRFIKHDKSTKGSEFVNEVLDLCRRIQSILKVGKLMAKHENDMEMSVDILYNLANNFSETPELLINWQQKMIDTHCQNKYFSEAAMCSLHSAAIIVQLLQPTERCLKDGLQSYKEISHNILEYTFIAKKDEIVDSDLNYQTLYSHLISSAGYFIKAERYESVSNLFKCILPILEQKKNYSELSQIYSKLSQSYNKISNLAIANKRSFCAYFRVAFYGKGFKEDNGKNFIYKEPPFTPLASIRERIEGIYTAKYGNIQIILETGKVKVKDLDPELNYIQINSVKARDDYYFEFNNNSEFEKNTNIKSFVMEAPFTESGKPRGEIHEQCKRITTFHTYHVFPYMKKRLNILYKQVVNLTPIEVAVGEMKTQASELKAATSLIPPDMKRLQLKLQGSVSCQVNAGPLAYAQTFLDETKKSKYDKKYCDALEDAFVDFLLACENALQLNSELVQADQMLYHNDMCEKFAELKTQIIKLIPKDKLDAPTTEPVITM